MSLIKKRKSEIDQHLGELEGFEDFGKKEDQPDPEPKPERLPKPVKPLSQKHFAPILDEVKSIKSMQDEIKANQVEILAVLASFKKTEPEKEKPIEESK